MASKGKMVCFICVYVFESKSKFLLLAYYHKGTADPFQPTPEMGFNVYIWDISLIKGLTCRVVGF